MVTKRERKVGQLISKLILEDDLLVVLNALLESQIISKDEWITIEVATMCRLRSSGDDLERSKR